MQVAATISELTAEAIENRLPALCALLIDIVEDGASIGFHASLDAEEATRWWRDWGGEIASGLRLVWIAENREEIVGTIHLCFSPKPTAWNRAEVQKLLVHRRARRQGIGELLMLRVEAACREKGRNLIYLDTETRSPAERLYQKLGFTRLGDIPDYSSDPSGVLGPTTIYYKLLEERPR